MGRVASRCLRHPNAKELSDIDCCKGCRGTDLMEFDLPKGMEKGARGLQTEIAL